MYPDCPIKKLLSVYSANSIRDGIFYICVLIYIQPLPVGRLWGEGAQEVQKATGPSPQCPGENFHMNIEEASIIP